MSSGYLMLPCMILLSIRLVHPTNFLPNFVRYTNPIRENISVGYWHLSANNPVAINPRTGRPYAVGDMVYQGEIIAYAGRTGNANRVPYAHLHLSIKKNGLFVDPMLYINGHLDSTGAGAQILVSSTEIRNIICDNEQTIQ